MVTGLLMKQTQEAEKCSLQSPFVRTHGLRDILCAGKDFTYREICFPINIPPKCSFLISKCSLSQWSSEFSVRAGREPLPGRQSLTNTL